MDNFEISIHVFNGPSLSVPYRAVRLRFNRTELFGDSSSISAQEIAALEPFFPENVFQRLASEEEYADMADFIAALAMSIQEVNDGLGLKYDIDHDHGGETEILMGFCSEQGARSALHSAMRLAMFVKGRLSGSQQGFQDWLQRLFLHQKRLQPLSTSARMLKYSRQAGIPYYQLDATSRHISYGQGVHSTLYNGSLSSRDSHIGEELQRNKYLTNKLLKAVGYPCTTQYLAYDLATMRDHVRKLGFPLVIKPSSASRGTGVTSNIRDANNIDSAFRFAASYSNGEVIVERFIAGDEHRITVSNGKVLGVVHKAPPTVTGDGHSTIGELIEAENAARLANKTRGGWHNAIPVDKALHELLKFKHLTVDSVPEPGQTLVLRDNGSVATGGTRPSVIHATHPDIAEMAISIARVFRLSTIGVDFITTDISASWRDTGKIIEVNAFPSLFGNFSELMLQEFFPTDRRGRIPSVLIVTDSPASSTAKLQGKLHEELTTGYVDGNTTLLDGVERRFDGENLYRRCVSLLIDTLCEAIVVVANVNEVSSNGLPLEFFDEVYIETQGARPEDLAPQLRRGSALHSLLDEHSSTLTYI